MTDLAQILTVAVPAATSVAGAAALIWRTQRADVADLAAKLDAAARKRDELHAETVARLEAQIAAARDDAARQIEALTRQTDALDRASAIMERLERRLDSADERESETTRRRTRS